MVTLTLLPTFSRPTHRNQMPPRRPPPPGRVTIFNLFRHRRGLRVDPARLQLPIQPCLRIQPESTAGDGHWVSVPPPASETPAQTVQATVDGKTATWVVTTTTTPDGRVLLWYGNDNTGGSRGRQVLRRRDLRPDFYTSTSAISTPAVTATARRHSGSVSECPPTAIATD